MDYLTHFLSKMYCYIYITAINQTLQCLVDQNISGLTRTLKLFSKITKQKQILNYCKIESSSQLQVMFLYNFFLDAFDYAFLSYTKWKIVYMWTANSLFFLTWFVTWESRLQRETKTKNKHKNILSIWKQKQFQNWPSTWQISVWYYFSSKAFVS